MSKTLLYADLLRFQGFIAGFIQGKSKKRPLFSENQEMRSLSKMKPDAIYRNLQKYPTLSDVASLKYGC